MSENPGNEFHSIETMRLLKAAALPTHSENFGLPGEVSRRSLLKLLMGASAALALGVPGCERKPRRKIVSRSSGPEYQKPGEPLYYASTWTEGPYPYGLLIKTVDGRPIKIDGNPDHPVNRGTSTAAMQASLLSLYDPDRLRAPQQSGETIGWAAADERISAALRSASSVVLITRATLGPAERALLAKFLEICPTARHFVHETVHDGPRRSVWRTIYGGDGEILPRFDQAKVIVSLDCDFLGTDGAALESIRGFAEGRILDDVKHRQATMNRLYVVEGAMSLTGANADQRVRARPAALPALALALLQAALGGENALAAVAAEHGLNVAGLEALARDLLANRGAALIVAGAHLPPAVHAAAALLNDELGAPGRTLQWNASPTTLPVSNPAEVEAALETGVDVLVCLGVNPVYDWPGGGFKRLLDQAGLSVGHGLYLDETLSGCDLALPSAHNLEAWNDAEPRRGLKTLCQPVIAPLFETRQAAESLLAWTRALSPADDPIQEAEDWHAYLQARWERQLVADGGEHVEQQRARAWENVLRTGGWFQTSETPFPALNRDAAREIAHGAPRGGGPYELVILPHHAVYDGRFANNGWLQELPEAASKLVWDNAAALSPKTAADLGAVEGDLLSVTVAERTVELPALIEPGMAEGVVAVALGYGRVAGGHVAREAGGANVAPLIGQEDPSVPRLAINARLRKAGGSRKLVRTQKEFSMHDRPIVLDGDLAEYRREADFVKHKRHLPKHADLYEPFDYSKGHKWGMAIDLGACVGCGACVAACQAENNIPIVGRTECGLGREMHWIRIDRYHTGDPDNPTVHHQPMLCQQCDNAPCENVCPVNATTHSPDGLNEMIYNRCVGTRYCANNCPYKVRRFNFMRYQQAQLRDPVQELVFNPQVTVRGVGVMEKCTFCVQRISAARFKAANQGQPLTDGAVQTACEQACPARAIVFGDLNDPHSRIAKLKSSGRAFHVLEELNVKPNVTYLARVRNPNPSAAPESAPPPPGSHQE